MRSKFLAVAFGVFAFINLAVMMSQPATQTVPFHLIFFALTVLYGFDVWSRNTSLVLLVVVTVSTGIVLVSHARDGVAWEEVAETLLMALIFLGAMWHVERRARLQQRVETLADEQRRILDREQQFMQDAAHALRTPLTIARGHLDLARASIHDLAALDDTDVVEGQLDRLKNLATMLVTLDRIASSQDELREPTDLTDLATRMFDRWARTFDREWQLDTDRRPQMALVDAHLIAMALDAVLENAVNNTAPGDAIRLVVQPSNENVVLEVDDGGPGVPEEEREHVFTRFARGRGAQRHSGSGLGLALVRGVAEAHGGTARIETSQLGGAAVLLTLPALALDTTTADQSVAQNRLALS